MYTVKGYVGSEEKLRTYFAGCAFEKKPRVLFVTDEILSDHITISSKNICKLGCCPLFSMFAR